MTWWRLLLFAWGIGAIAAFPALFEFNDSIHEGQDQPLPLKLVLGLSVFMAAVWPLAWLSLIWFTVRRAGRP